MKVPRRASVLARWAIAAVGAVVMLGYSVLVATSQQARGPTSSPHAGLGASAAVSGRLASRASDGSLTSIPSQASSTVDRQPASADPVEALLDERLERDRTVWGPEVEAQRHETRFVALWDELLRSENRFAVLASFPFTTLAVGRPLSRDQLELDIQRTRFSKPERELSPADWRALLERFDRQGYEIVHTEWHHSAFEPATPNRAARSEVSGLIHAARTDPPHRVILRFILDIVWSEDVRLKEPVKQLRSAGAAVMSEAELWAAKTPEKEGQSLRCIGAWDCPPFSGRFRGATSPRRLMASQAVKPDATETSSDEIPVPERIAVADLELLERHAQPPFREVLTVEGTPRRPRMNPLLVYDLDGDGLSEVVLGGQNMIMWNQGGGRFEGGRFLPNEGPFFGAGVLADFTGDGHVDFVGVDLSRHPLLFEAEPGGRFTKPGRRIADVQFPQPMTFTAGDVDKDGDLDLYIANYKVAYEGGQMATPYFDANDGYPAYLLRNDGGGAFSDVTEASGLGPKRFRRAYSSSLVDLDNDLDADLVVVADYAGLDIYLNDGRGRFTDVSDRLGGHRRAFGMAHTFGDYDLDGDLDLYVIGMSSTTARRLERMGLGPQEKPEHNAMRPAMSYGNRMFLREGDFFKAAPFNDQVARTGWSWGTASFDFDNDGDEDIFVANGHVSGQSTRDYCTTFWRHDIYTDDSKPDFVRESMFQHVMRPLQDGKISWNGYEHKVLWLNLRGAGFASAAFLMGVAFEYDGRAVVADDLDADGRVDLLVVEVKIGDASQPDRYVLHLYKNELSDAGNWIGVRLHDSHGLSPIGATVTAISAAGRRIARIVTGDSYAAQHPATVHFGLGSMTEIEAIEVRWFNGVRRRIERPGVNQYLTVRPR